MGLPKEGLEKVTIKSTDGSATITHVRYPEGDGTTIVTQTEVNGMKGHTTIHPDDDPHYHHPETKK